MDNVRIRIRQKKLDDFCCRNHIHKLAFFGSVLRDNFGPDIDVDVLIQFEPGQTPRFAVVRMAEKLEKILGREIDLTVFRGVKTIRNPIQRKAILRSARVYYVA